MIGAPVFRYVLTPGWAGDSLARAAQAVPSLDLNFAATKNLGPLVTFTRASSATYVGSDGLIKTATTNEPRFDHNPTTGESLGLLVEEQRSNQHLQSGNLSGYVFTAAGAGDALTNLYGTSASGVANQTLRVQTGAAAKVVRWSSFDCGIDAISTSYVISFFYRGALPVSVAARAGVAAPATIIYPPSGENMGRAQASITSGTNGTAFLDLTYAGNSDGQLWGMQVEKNTSFPTSYIPTATAAATRSADVANNTTVGSNIRSLLAQFRSPASGTRPVVSLDDNTANERIEILTSGTDPKLLVTDGGSTVADLNGGTVTANVTAKAAAVFDTNSYAFSVNGGASQLDSSGALPTVNRIRIGSNQAGGYLNGTIARVVGWDVALANLPPITQ
jgi:hypothetical protein